MPSTRPTDDRATRAPPWRRCSSAQHVNRECAPFGRPSARTTPLRALVLQYTFTEVGEQWDDEDGLETIFEVDADLFP